MLPKSWIGTPEPIFSREYDKVLDMTECYDTEINPFVRETYSHDELVALRMYLESQGTFDFAPLASGLYPATPSTMSEDGRYRYAWVRDNVYIAHSLWRAGREDEALAVARALIQYFDTHATRFDEIIVKNDKKEDPMNRPHVRFDGDTLEEVAERWPHAQNDAHGLFLWLTGCMVQEGLIELDPTLLRVVARTISFLGAVRYFEDADSGAWEEGRAVRASSIGAVCAGLLAWHDALHDYDHTRSHFAFELYQQGMAALNTILPYEVRGGETVRAYDAALLFLVSPLGLISGDKAHEIVERIRTQLMGGKGIKRYEGDAFWGPDYDQVSPAIRTSDASEDASFRAKYAVVGKEAEWTIFDTLLAVYFATRGREKAEEHEEDMRASATHLNRTLSALVRTSGGKLLLPELYYSRQGSLVPNTILPLYWAQANVLYALATLGVKNV